MKIYYIGNQVVGLIGKLTVLSQGYQITDKVEDSDILLCVHGRKIISKEIFEKPKIASINIHPYLYTYKGSDPVGRAIIDANWHASVGCHYISEIVDGGEVIREIFADVLPSNNRCEIYSQLYPLYSRVIAESLDIIEKDYLNNLEEPDILVGGLGREYL